MKLLLLCLLVSLLTSLTSAAPLVFAATIVSTSTLARGLYRLLGIEPERFFTTEGSIFE